MYRGLSLTLMMFGWLAITCSSGELANGQGMQSASIGVSFRKDLAPILAAKCLRCHGPDEAEGDFRVDEASSWENYAEPLDLENSEVWRLVNSTEEGERMPPDMSEHLTQSELSAMEGWIQLGAKFEEVDDWDAKKYEGTDLAKTDSVAAAVWALLGRFHPALVHFPIALLLVSAAFAVFSFGSVHMDKAAVYCLMLGTLGSIAAAASGWGFAEYRKWPPMQAELRIGKNEAAKPETAEQTKGAKADPKSAPADDSGNAWNVENFILFDGTERSMHRWGGVGVALLSVVVSLLALYIRRDPDRSQFTWKLASVVLAGLVSWVGHQGGEIHYGSDLYSKPIERIRQLLEEKADVPEESKASAPATTNETTEDPVTEEPATEEPVTEEPATEEPATEEPVTEKKATEQKAAAGEDSGSDKTEADSESDES